MATFIIDISHHQDLSLDLAAARRDGCEAVFIKAGEGSSMVDAEFAVNLAKARAAGQLVAAYWYQKASASAAAHVAKIKETVPKDVPVILDVEANSGNVALTRELVGLLNVAGYRTPLLYIPRWYWQQIGSPTLAGLPPLWSSRYPNNTVGLLADEWSQVPASYWTGYGGLDVAALQFTSSARIAGYQPLDASAYRGTRDELAALLYGAPAPAPTTTGSAEIMEPIHAKASTQDANGNWSTETVRVRVLTGSASAGIVIRPTIDGTGFAPLPVWLGHVFAWKDDKVGIGYDPRNIPGYDLKIVADRRIPLPGALWCDVEYSCATDFYIQPLG